MNEQIHFPIHTISIHVLALAILDYGLGHLYYDIKVVSRTLTNKPKSNRIGFPHSEKKRGKM